MPRRHEKVHFFPAGAPAPLPSPPQTPLTHPATPGRYVGAAPWRPADPGGRAGAGRPPGLPRAPAPPLLYHHQTTHTAVARRPPLRARAPKACRRRNSKRKHTKAAMPEGRPALRASPRSLPPAPPPTCQLYNHPPTDAAALCPSPCQEPQLPVPCTPPLCLRPAGRPTRAPRPPAAAPPVAAPPAHSPRCCSRAPGGALRFGPLM
jgi:hypothetical protein